MNTEHLAIYNKNGYVRALKTADRTTLKPGEVGLVIRVNIDDSVFAPPAMPTINLTVDRSQLIQTVSASTGEGEGE